jgi:uncharacterized membrane protein
MNKYWKVFFVCLLIVAALFSLFFENFVLSLVVMFFSPGYLLLSLIYHRSNQFKGWLLLPASIGVSSVFSGLLGLINSYSLQLAISWVIGGSSLLMGIILLVIIFVGDYDDQSPPIFSDRPEINLWTYLKILAVALSVFAVGMLGYGAATKLPQYSEFYLLDNNREIPSYQTELLYGDNLELSLGIFNHNELSEEYLVVVYVNGEPNRVVYPIIVENNTRHEFDLQIKNLGLGEDQKIEILLGNEGRDFPYRRLHLWFDVNHVE